MNNLSLNNEEVKFNSKYIKQSKEYYQQSNGLTAKRNAFNYI